MLNKRKLKTEALSQEWERSQRRIKYDPDLANQSLAKAEFKAFATSGSLVHIWSSEQLEVIIVL